jgi:hypothetical protein
MKKKYPAEWYQEFEFLKWMQMMSHCYSPKNKIYAQVGAKGVQVYLPWHSYETFRAYVASVLGPRPSPSHKLCRLPNPDGNFEPANLRWATPREWTDAYSLLHPVSSPLLTAFGRTQSLVDWAKETGINVATITTRLRKGTAVERALNPISLGTTTLTMSGKTLDMAAWAKVTGLSEHLLRQRVAQGWADEVVLTAPKPARLGPPRKLPEVGQVFGRLTVIGILPLVPKRPTRIQCRCQCGRVTTPVASAVTGGATKSCGCLGPELQRARATHTGKRNEREYHLWRSMNMRCYNTSNPSYHNYGGRGIQVCQEWRDSYEAYRDYIRDVLGPRPSSKHSIDRIDNDGNYQPGNLRWATQQEQARNSRTYLAHHSAPTAPTV